MLQHLQAQDRHSPWQLADMADFKLKVDESNKATELPLLRVCGTVQQNPHMRAFWGSVFSFFLAFLGWFALAPLGLEVATSINMCENQKFPPAEYPLRPAYLKYKSLKTGLEYCQYGKVKDGDTITDCAAVPANVMSSATATAEEKSPYAPSVLGQMRVHHGHRVQWHDCERRRCRCCFHHLRSHRPWHPPGALRSSERASQPTHFRSVLGGHGRGHFRSLELRADSLLHRLRRTHVSLSFVAVPLKSLSPV